LGHDEVSAWWMASATTCGSLNKLCLVRSHQFGKCCLLLLLLLLFLVVLGCFCFVVVVIGAPVALTAFFQKFLDELLTMKKSEKKTSNAQ